MKLEWVIESKDVARVKALLKEFEHDSFVRDRNRRNLGQSRPRVSRARAWEVMVGCLLTTQQRSGPGKPVDRFVRLSPFPLSYSHCLEQSQLENFALKALTAFRGIRRSRTIAAQVAGNLRLLEQGHWSPLLEQVARVDVANDSSVERVAARYVAETFSGFGPKQARNFLQWLGVSKYEIPIDSRVTKWLNRELLSIHLNANMLSDVTYYEMVSDGVIELCRIAGVIPCLFDAAVFTSFDKPAHPPRQVAAQLVRGA